MRGRGGRSARPDMRRAFSGDLFNPGVKTFPSVFVRVCPSRGDALLKHLMAVKKCFQPLDEPEVPNGTLHKIYWLDLGVKGSNEKKIQAR